MHATSDGDDYILNFHISKEPSKQKIVFDINISQVLLPHMHAGEYDNIANMIFSDDLFPCLCPNLNCFVC